MTGRMQDVAQLAGVSRATVSLVLSGRPGTRVSPPTVRRVLEAATHLGYEPRPRPDDGGWVALMVESSTGAVLDLLAGALEAAWLHRCAAVVVPVGLDGAGRQSAADALARGPRDRVAYLGLGEPGAETLSALPNRPLVVSCLRGPGQDAPASYRRVVADDEQAASHTARALARQGHERVAVVADPAEAHTASAWVQGLARGDHLFLKASLVPTAQAQPGGRSLPDLLERPRADRPTVLICMSRGSAAHTIRATAERGLRIPDDVSIVLRDDGSGVPPRVPHTPLRPPARAMGRATLELLLETPAGDRVRSSRPADVKIPFAPTKGGWSPRPEPI